MPTYYSLKMASTTMYYMITTATNKDTDQEEEISLKATVDESKDYTSNAITEGEDGNEFQYEIENATEIPESDVPENVIEKFEDRIDLFENRYVRISISKSGSSEEDN